MTGSPAWIKARLNDAQRLRSIRLLALLVFPLGCGLAALAIGQDLSFDFFNYHFYNAWAFLHGRNLTDVFPGNTATLVNPLLDIPNYLLIRHISPRFAAFAVGFEQGSGPLLVYLAARRLTGARSVALAAGVASAVAGGFASELGDSLGDTIVAPFFLAGILCALVAFDERRSTAERSPRPVVPDGPGVARRPRRRPLRALSREWRWWLASGLGAGLGAGLKLAEFPIAVAMVLATLAVPGTAASRIRSFAVCMAGCAVGVAATAGYWSYFLWRHFGDPFAFTGGSFWVFHFPYAPASNGNGAKTATLVHALYYPIYWFFHPLAVGEIPLREASVPIAYVLLVVLLALTAARGVGHALRWSPRGVARARRRRTTPEEPSAHGHDRYLIAMFVVTLVVWLKMFGIYRYILPLELTAPLVVISAGRRIAGLLGELTIHKRTLAAIFFCLCTVCVATEYPADYWERLPFGRTEFSVATPAMLENGRLDAVVVLGNAPASFVFTLLHARFIAIGEIVAGIGPSMLTSATLRLTTAAFAKVRRAGGDVVGMWVSSPPTSSSSTLLAAIGDPGMRQVGCVTETLYVAAGYEPIGFCKFAPEQPRR